MLIIQLAACMVFLIARFDVTCSVDSISISTTEDSSSFYYSDSSPDLQVQDLIEDAKVKCVSQRVADDVAKFLTSFADDLAEAIMSRLNKIDDNADSEESSARETASSQINRLKHKVTATASKANCPAPDDPSLMGEFDSIFELVYEMCFTELIEHADMKRNKLGRRMEILLNSILSSVSSIRKTSDPNGVCLHTIEESKTVLDEVQSMEENYILELRSVYGSCSNIAYEQAEKFMPSVIRRATSCRTMNSIGINSLIDTGRNTMKENFV